MDPFVSNLVSCVNCFIQITMTAILQTLDVYPLVEQNDIAMHKKDTNMINSDTVSIPTYVCTNSLSDISVWCILIPLFNWCNTCRSLRTGATRVGRYVLVQHVEVVMYWCNTSRSLCTGATRVGRYVLVQHV